MLKNFMLTKSSPLKNKGISIENSKGKDLFGNRSGERITIGAHEY